MRNDLVGDLYNLLRRQMRNLIGYGGDFDSLEGALRDIADKSLIVFRDVLDANLSASNNKPHGPEWLSAIERLEHAEHELSLLTSALSRAKEKLASKQRLEMQAH